MPMHFKVASKDLFLLFLFIYSLALFNKDLYAKTIVIGFDGMDPVILENWMNEGHLPNFSKLKEQGFFSPLQTTNPAQSPVAWASFATGLNPGEHGIFDFIHRNPKSMAPDYSISGIKSSEPYELYGIGLPYKESIIYNKRIGKPFWLSAEQMGVPSSVLRVPATYPPDEISHMLSGMGVPDLLGTQGTFSYYSTKFIDPNSTGGQITRVSIKNNQIDTEMLGPQNPLGSSPMSIPMIIKPTKDDSVSISLGDQNIDISEGQWSDWTRIKFKYGGIFSVKGMVRVYLEEAFPRFKMYVSPINVDPQNPVVPISSPPQFASELSDDIGLFHTLGMPEETWSLNDGLIDDETYLEMIKTVLAEREAMFFHELKQQDKELVIGVFVQTDRVSHMFWRGYDENHPAHNNASETAKNAIFWIYQEADRILGKTMQQINSDDRLIVLSDHGFAPYYYHVNINKWLLDNGYLVLKDPSTVNFEAQDIDWSKTAAYAMGLNGIYANLSGREANGWLDQEQANNILQEISQSIKTTIDPNTATKIVRSVYTSDEVYHGYSATNAPDLVLGYERGYRASWQTVLGGSDEIFLTINHDKWSGDHCIDPHLVPGILLTNFKTDKQLTHIEQIASEVLSNYDDKLNNDEVSGPAGLFDIVYSAVDNLNKALLTLLPSTLVIMVAGLLFASWQIFLFKVTKFIKKIGFGSYIVRWFIWVCSALILLQIVHLQHQKLNIIDTNELIIKAIPTDETTLPQLQWTTFNSNAKLNEVGHNEWLIQANNLKEPYNLRETDGMILYQLDNKMPLLNKVKASWGNYFISNPGGYLHELSQVEAIKISRPDTKNIPIFWFFIGIFLASIVIYSLRYLKTSQ